MKPMQSKVSINRDRVKETVFKLKNQIDQVRSRRLELDLSQKAIADAIGVNRIAIINLEKKRTHLKYDKMIVLLDTLGLS